MESLSDNDLAAFLTLGLQVKTSYYPSPFMVDITFVKQRYIQSQLGVKQWLNEEQEFEKV